ncbi:MAG: chorismate synthase, partial [Spirochaetales bacterium]|nr:chorismate synthase [Spirochaetales bacterium]
MKNTFGSSVAVTIFGESHGEAVGVVIDGLAPGLTVNDEFIRSQLDKRKPTGTISTSRREADKYSIVSGVYNGLTTGTPICILIPNENKHSSDYDELRRTPRPSHADWTAECKYHGYQDYRGGGHFSGRITAALVAAGSIAIDALRAKNILIGTHIARLANIQDRTFRDYNEDIAQLNNMNFAVLDENAAAEMHTAAESAAADGDSVGGVLETAVIGVPSGVGEPWFDTMESVLSHILFSVPAIKGVEFG